MTLSLRRSGAVFEWRQSRRPTLLEKDFTKSSAEYTVLFEIIHRTNHNIEHLRAFGSKAFGHAQAQKLDRKLYDTSREDIFVGYCKGYMYCRFLLDRGTRELIRNVNFHESVLRKILKKHPLLYSPIEFNLSDPTVISNTFPRSNFGLTPSIKSEQSISE